ncbi:MAG: hypothetical protein CMK70_09935 [Pseudohongiella sp.]|nr:hypothetical protein [Pseudohongiella sp.]|tara:strand:- start:2668 stop:3114 length:447 start_codon:yes stop_codon:yes gene_type:complete
MKRIALILSSAVLVVVVALALWQNHDRGQAVEQASRLMQEVTQAALSDWDPTPVLANAAVPTPEPMQEAPMVIVFNSLQRLGELRQMGEVQMEVDIPPIWQTSRAATAGFITHAEFEYGNAEIRITMERKSGRWYFTSFRVLTSLLAA